MDIKFSFFFFLLPSFFGATVLLGNWSNVLVVASTTEAGRAFVYLVHKLLEDERFCLELLLQQAASDSLWDCPVFLSCAI